MKYLISQSSYGAHGSFFFWCHLSSHTTQTETMELEVHRFMNWYKGWRVRTRMSLEINLLIKNQWQDLISVTCVLIRKRYRQEKKLVVCLCIILSIESWLKSWYIQKYVAIIIWRKCFMSWMTRASILLVCVHQFEIVVASGATVFLSSAAVKKVDCDADGEY